MAELLVDSVCTRLCTLYLISIRLNSVRQEKAFAKTMGNSAHYTVINADCGGNALPPVFVREIQAAIDSRCNAA